MGDGSRSALISKNPNERGVVTPQNVARVGLCFINLNFLVIVIGVRDLGCFFHQLCGCLVFCLVELIEQERCKAV